MKNYNKILEAIHRGIKLAIDDYDFDNSNLQSSTSDIIDDGNFSEYIRFRDIINKLLNDDPSLPRKIDQIKVYKEMVELHNKYGFLYKVKTLEELKFIIEKFVNIWRTTTKNFNWIDVSSLTSLKYAFSTPSIRDYIGFVEIDEWNVSNVTDISMMAWNCKWFNADLSKWNVRNVEFAIATFLGCKDFNSDLSNWDVRNLKDSGSMFLYCDKFNSDLSKWNTSSLIDTSQMFKECKAFNSDLSNWDVRNVQSANLMFAFCEQFNQDLSNWELNKCNNINRGQWFRQMFEHTPMEYKFDFYPPKLVTPMMKKKK